MATSTKKLLFLLLIPLSAAESCAPHRRKTHLNLSKGASITKPDTRHKNSATDNTLTQPTAKTIQHKAASDTALDSSVEDKFSVGNISTLEIQKERESAKYASDLAVSMEKVVAGFMPLMPHGTTTKKSIVVGTAAAGAAVVAGAATAVFLFLPALDPIVMGVLALSVVDLIRLVKDVLWETSPLEKHDKIISIRDEVIAAYTKSMEEATVSEIVTSVRSAIERFKKLAVCVIGIAQNVASNKQKVISVTTAKEGIAIAQEAMEKIQKVLAEIRVSTEAVTTSQAQADFLTCQATKKSNALQAEILIIGDEVVENISKTLKAAGESLKHKKIA